MQSERDAREERISSVIAITLEFRSFSNGRYEMSLPDGTHDILVRDLSTDLLVAFSSTKADFENSLVEFASDYFA